MVALPCPLESPRKTGNGNPAGKSRPQQLPATVRATADQAQKRRHQTLASFEGFLLRPHKRECALYDVVNSWIVAPLERIARRGGSIRQSYSPRRGTHDSWIDCFTHARDDFSGHSAAAPVSVDRKHATGFLGGLDNQRRIEGIQHTDV